MATAATRSLYTEEEQGAAFVELFFDLVFVFAITQVTSLVLNDLTFAGIGKALLIFWMIWWGWTQFTWALNPANTDHVMVRLWTLVAAGVAFIMAVSVGDAFGDGGLLFAGTYVAVRLIGLGLFYKISTEQPELSAAVRLFTLRSLGGLALAILGGFMVPELRVWIWLGVVLLDMWASGTSGSRGGWDLHPGHFAERHGLFVIIALGESLVAAGVAASHQDLTTPLLLVALGAVSVTCLLWWSYFGWLKEGLERALRSKKGSGQSILARNAYSLVHFPLVVGVIAIAVGVEEMVAHPTDPLHTGPLAAFATGIVLFIGAAAVAWLIASGKLLWRRVTIVVATAIALLLLPTAMPLWVLGITSVALLIILVLEFSRCTETVAHGAE